MYVCMTPGMPLTETKIHYHINKSEKIFYVRMYGFVLTAYLGHDVMDCHGCRLRIVI